MVYKCDAVKTPIGIDTVNNFYVRLFQPMCKVFLRAYVLHGFDDFLACPFGKTVSFYQFNGCIKFLLQCLMTEYLSELTGLERRSHPHPVIVQRSVHDAVVFFSVHISPYFINRHVVKFQQGVVFGKRMKVVTFQQGTGGML